MIPRVIKRYTPNYKCLDSRIEQAKAIQDLYDQVRIFYDYLNDPSFKESLKGDTGDTGPKGDDGKSAFELWKELPGNENKSIIDYFNEIQTDPNAYHGKTLVVELNESIEVHSVAPLNSQLDIIYLNVSNSTITVTVTPSEVYKTPDNEPIELLISSKGYGELNILNVDNVMFVRGA